MRVAAIYDIHGNLPALDAVLSEIRAAGVERIVVGGDVLPGPVPVETLMRLFSLEIPTQFIQGNGEVAVLATIVGRRCLSAARAGATSHTLDGAAALC